ncbi:hypothetical protein NHX12_024844 [Muraenolepis orangiensis]|uniref:Uncharacterized protein n=1 Tax=Muraenolepis orangiensis TaxID=630683 RepID=A0A9Q0EK87_9TELE|nr:hypothetical protein NHX12_024844 [Muraenolepis orangiensis]
MEVLARYCSIPGYNKLCCESCNKKDAHPTDHPPGVVPGPQEPSHTTTTTRPRLTSPSEGPRGSLGTSLSPPQTTKASGRRPRSTAEGLGTTTTAVVGGARSAFTATPNQDPREASSYSSYSSSFLAATVVVTPEPTTDTNTDPRPNHMNYYGDHICIPMKTNGFSLPVNCSSPLTAPGDISAVLSEPLHIAAIFHP